MPGDATAILADAGALLWLTILLLPWQPWRTRERLEPGDAAAPAELSDVTVLIPARDEAPVIGQTLAALRAQGSGLAVIVIDDQSRDQTGTIASASGLENLRVIAGSAPPPGWTGKLWALEQGRLQATSPLLLLLDADIALAPLMLDRLRHKLRQESLAMVSLMAWLRMDSAWEKLLLPAFVYFFKLLYPFALANRAGTRVAAAAGGCILLERARLDELGGFAALKGALIDDCTLARLIKRRGGRIWIGLSHGAKSLRGHDRLAPIWSMVARTAYTQLGYSPPLLGLCTLVMVAMVAGPLVGLAFRSGTINSVLWAAGLGAMVASYVPVLRYYRLSPAWALLMPVICGLFLAMTWTSALRHWRGQGAHWKGRSYRAGAG